MTNNWIEKVLLAAPVGVGSLLLLASSGFATTESSITQKSLVPTQPLTIVPAKTQPLTIAPAAKTQTVAQAVIADISVPAAPAKATLQSKAADPDSSEMDQVTAVSQLTDVRPTDWAFQALQSLVERYGCIAGYPDKTYRGSQALTRYEFAAGLNACLDRVNELIAAGTGDLVKKEDLATVRRLQDEYQAELATLRGRVDTLENRTATLEKQQFSTTTKLSGLVWMNLTGAGASDDVRYEGPNDATGRGAEPANGRFFTSRTNGRPTQQTTGSPSTTFSFLTWLTLNTSFTGRDSLVTQLAAGNGVSPANQYASAGFFNSFGVPFTDQTGGTFNGRSDIVIHDLFYSFPVGNSIKVTVGPRVNWYRTFDFNRFTFFLNGAGSFDSVGSTQTNAIDRGSGAVVEWNISKQLRFAVAYLGENTEFLPTQFGFNTSSNPKYGLFGGTNTSTAELTFSPNDKINLRFLYNYSRIQAYNGQVGGAIGEPIPYGYLDAGPGFSEGGPGGFPASGGLKFATANTLAINFDWLITPGFGVFGRYSYGSTNLEPIDKKVRSQSFQVGAGFPDLFKKGALGVVTFLMPMDILEGRRYFASGAGDGGTMYELEASYFYPISQNLALVPSFYTIFNANNFDSNPTIFVGNLRAQFSF